MFLNFSSDNPGKENSLNVGWIMPNANFVLITEVLTKTNINIFVSEKNNYMYYLCNSYKSSLNSVSVMMLQKLARQSQAELHPSKPIDQV